MFVGWCAVFAIIVRSYVHGSVVNWDGLVSALPFLWLVGYGTACALLNRTTIAVSKSGIDVATGPLPAGGRRKIGLKQITRCYWRAVVFPVRFGALRTHTAGAEMTDGVRVDLLADYESKEEARKVAREIADALGVSAEEALGVGKRDWVALRRVILWAALLVMTLVFAALKSS